MYQRYPQSCDIPVFCSQGSFSVVDQLFRFEGGPLLHQKEHNLLFIDAFFKGWDAQLWHQTASGLWYHEESRLHIKRVTSSFVSQIWILNLLISTDSSLVVSYLNKQEGSHFQECVPLSEESFLGRMPGGSDSGRSLPRESKCFSRFLVHKRQDDSN